MSSLYVLCTKREGRDRERETERGGREMCFLSQGTATDSKPYKDVNLLIA